MPSEPDLTLSRVYELYDKFIIAEEVDELELGLTIPNIFEVLKVTGKEIRHSNFLAWLLNPKESHGLGDLFLKRFLRKLFASEKVTALDPVSVMEADLSKALVKREWKHIDLLIEMEDIVILIENKFYGKERKGQLQNYKKRVEKEYPKHKKVYAFLTPDGLEPEAERVWYQEISYQSIIDIIEKILTLYDQNVHPSAKIYLTDYQTILKRELMSGDELSELAQRIYYNHKELMDFIIENRPDMIDEVREKLLSMLKDKGFEIGSKNKYYARFYTKKIEPFIFEGSKYHGWKDKESFLFEIFIGREKLNIRTVIAPTDANYDREKVAEILEQVEGSTKSRGDIWLIYLDKSYPFNADNLYNMADEIIEQQLEKFFNTLIHPMVEKVEKAFLENSELLLSLKKKAEKERD